MGVNLEKTENANSAGENEEVYGNVQGVSLEKSSQQQINYTQQQQVNQQQVNQQQSDSIFGIDMTKVHDTETRVNDSLNETLDQVTTQVNDALGKATNWLNNFLNGLNK